MTEPSILFCTPCYGGMVTAAHFRSCLNLTYVLDKLQIGHDWNVPEDNDSLVHRARMEMAATYLFGTEHTHLFWIDADIDFTPDDVAKVWNLEADIGVGVYAMKKRDKQWYAAWKDGKLIKDLDQFKEPVEVDLAGTGFMLIKREVLEKLAECTPSYEGPNGRVPAIFMTPIHDDGLESEDYHFSRIAREAGFKIMMDPSIRLGHWGMYRYGA